MLNKSAVTVNRRKQEEEETEEEDMLPLLEDGWRGGSCDVSIGRIRQRRRNNGICAIH